MENKIQDLLHNRLYPDLEKYQSQRSIVESKIRAYYELDLFLQLQILKPSPTISGLVKVACEFFMEAEGQADKISIETGIPGLYLDLTPSEGIEYIQKKQSLLQEQLNRCKSAIDQIEGHISTITQSLGPMSELIDIKESPEETELH